MPIHRLRPFVGLAPLLLAGLVVSSSAPAAAAPADRHPLAGPSPSQPDLRLRENARRLLDDGSAGLQRQRLAGEKAPAALRAIVLLCDFPDSAFYGRPGRAPEDPATSTQSDFYYLAHDSVYYHHFVRDVADYFDAVSGGGFELVFDVHGAILHLPQPMTWYGDHPQDGEQPLLLAADAVSAADPAVDFSNYDTVLLIHAGAGEETDILGDSAAQIYSTYLSPEDFADAVEDSVLATPYLPTDDFPAGEGVTHVLVLPENEFQDASGGLGRLGSLGVYCFEVGLRLGMLSLSDATPSGRPDSQGVGEFDLMGWGLYVGAGYIPPHPSAFNKVLMGWLAPRDVDPAVEGTWGLRPAENPADPRAGARVDVNGREYWLLEYRQQDPDGSGIFSFAGDLNGDNVPNFYDADSAYGDGRPTSWFDPATDVRERLVGAEWDFFMSENPAREPGVKGAGSGIYIWHVDEGVIQDAFGAESNLFNADPARKGVDLEEADGIQDLDSSYPSEWRLGGDDDSFRGEDAAVFGPDTRPATITAGGAPTGIVFEEISNVVVDSAFVFHAGTDSAYTGIAYADSMTFRCRRLAAGDDVLTRVVAYDLPDVDLAGGHLLAADLDRDDDDLEVVTVGRDGAVVVHDPGMAAPVVTFVLAAGDTVRFHSPAAAGRLAGADDAGGLDILLASDRGLHRFRFEAGALVPQGSDPTGLIGVSLQCVAAPVLWPTESAAPADFDPDLPMHAWVVSRGPAGDELLWVSADTGSRRIELGPGAVTAPPAAAAGYLWITLADTSDATARLVAHPLPGADGPDAVFTLDAVPGPWPVVVTVVDDELAVSVVDAEGGATTLWLAATDLVETRARTPWPVRVHSPLGPGLAFVGDEVIARAEPNGRLRAGWPRRPTPRLEGATDPARGAMALDVAEGLIFAGEDGRIYLHDTSGTPQPGWPIAGPADIAGTPVAADLDGDGVTELVVAGAFPRIVGLDAQGEELVTAPRSQLVVFTGLGPLPRGPRMWGGGPWRADWLTEQRLAAPGGDGAVLVAGSHICYPNPVTEDVLRVRGTAAGDGRARAVIMNLEGEEVADSGWIEVVGAVPFELELDFGDVAAGMYVCRLEVSTGGGGQTSIKTVAVAR